MRIYRRLRNFIIAIIDINNFNIFYNITLLLFVVELDGCVYHVCPCTIQTFIIAWTLDNVCAWICSIVQFFTFRDYMRWVSDMMQYDAFRCRAWWLCVSCVPMYHTNIHSIMSIEWSLCIDLLNSSILHFSWLYGMSEWYDAIWCKLLQSLMVMCIMCAHVPHKHS